MPIVWGLGGHILNERTKKGVLEGTVLQVIGGFVAQLPIEPGPLCACIMDIMDSNAKAICIKPVDIDSEDKRIDGP